ncbi:MAG: hypothetical protein WDN08_02715 [Rhizomicrobium sp.]
MKSTWINLGGVFAIAAVAVLLSTNPTLADFKTYIVGTPHYQGFLTGLLSSATCDDVQTGNYFVFSNYERRCITETQGCTGAFNTFFCGKTKPLTTTATPA